MAYLLSGEQPSAAATSIGPFATFVRWLAKARAKRAQQVALETLLEFEPTRLADLGINRQDLFEAMQHPSQRPGMVLNQRRARSAQAWLNP